MKQFASFSILLCSLFLWSGCADAPEKPTQLNPNGDSELALLMRAMADESEAMKKALQNGEKITLNVDHDAVLTAHATEPEKAASEEYKQFAKSYLGMIEALKEGNADQTHNAYRGMIETCVQCHEALCPGPLVRIEKMRLPKEK